MRGAISFKKYYRLLNDLYVTVYGRELMLHFPFYMNENESFIQRQNNLIDHCLSRLGDLSDQTLLEVGCGNGANCKYISEINDSVKIIGIDLNEDNLVIANQQIGSERTVFYHDDAQKLDNIEDSSVDVLICIESAFHYPDKSAFLNEIARVLKPGGHFLIADILTVKNKGTGVRKVWKKRMVLNHWHKHHYENTKY